MTEKKRPAGSRAKPRQAGTIGAAEFGEYEDTQVVGGLARGLSLLTAFRRNDRTLGNAELAKRTGLNKSTVSRMTYTLALHGFLNFDRHLREYSLGTQVIALGAIALATTNVRTLALPLMQDLAAHGNFNVGLGTRQDMQMIYTDTVEGGGLVGLKLYPGSRLPIATSAMGKAYLAGVDEELRSEVLTALKADYGNRWPAKRKGIEAALEEFGKAGFCSSIGDWQEDINGVAVPIAAGPGSPVYVLNLGGPAYLLPEKRLRAELAPRLLDVAREIEKVLGVIA